MFRALVLCAVVIASVAALPAKIPEEIQNRIEINDGEKKIILVNPKVIMYNAQVQMVGGPPPGEEEPEMPAYDYVKEEGIEETEPEDKGEEGVAEEPEKEAPAAPKTRAKRSYSSYSFYHGGAPYYGPGFGYDGNYYWNGYTYPYSYGGHYYPYGYRGSNYHYSYYNGYYYHFNARSYFGGHGW